MERRNTRKYDIEYLERPGLSLSDVSLARLARELTVAASYCFDEIPGYQALQGTRAALSDKIITIARRADGTLAGFCSAIVLQVPSVGEVLHLGLTCVRQEDRGTGLTHKLTGKLVTKFLLKNRPFGKQWITNVACVLSSVGNVAATFDAVFPSPGYHVGPTHTHRVIAAHIDRHHRDDIFIHAEAHFDPQRFVFCGSVKDTVFQKAADDESYHHRDPNLNRFYLDLLDFEQGDEVLQIGHYSLATLAKYALANPLKVRRRRQHRETHERQAAEAVRMAA